MACCPGYCASQLSSPVSGLVGGGSDASAGGGGTAQRAAAPYQCQRWRPKPRRAGIALTPAACRREGVAWHAWAPAGSSLQPPSPPGAAPDHTPLTLPCKPCRQGPLPAAHLGRFQLQPKSPCTGQGSEGRAAPKVEGGGKGRQPRPPGARGLNWALEGCTTLELPGCDCAKARRRQEGGSSLGSRNNTCAWRWRPPAAAPWSPRRPSAEGPACRGLPGARGPLRGEGGAQLGQ